MRVLLDECIDRRLATLISGHDVKTVPQAGWANFKNGELLGLAQHKFDVFITVDRNLPSQQNLGKYRIAVIVLRARTNRLNDLKPLIAELLVTLPIAKVGKATIVSSRN